MVSQVGAGASSVDLLVQQLMAPSKKPLDQMNNDKNDLKQRAAIFSDLKGYLSALQDVAADLADTSADSVFATRSVTSADAATVAASADSTADIATYTIEVTNLAKAHRIASTRQADKTTSLGVTGTFQINGKDVVIDGTNNSLSGIRDAINNTTYDSGEEVIATIVDNTLVIRAAETGVAKTITAVDTSGTVLRDIGVLDAQAGFARELQVAEDALFTIDGLSVTSGVNTGITAAIDGVTLELKAETGATPLTLAIKHDTATISSRINGLLSKFNVVMQYLQAKTAVSGSEKTSTRGPLAGETLVIALKTGLVDRLARKVTGLSASGPASLAEMGIAFDASLAAQVEDSTKLSDALADNLDEVQALFTAGNGIGKRIEDFLDSYTASSGVMENNIEGITAQQKNIDVKIKATKDRLALQEVTLRNQLSTMQQTLIAIQQQQQFFNSFFGSVSQ